MANTENETRRDDANTEQQKEGQTEQVRDLEPEKDVTGGGWPTLATGTQTSGGKG
jgi:hypothetical protein